MEHFLCFRWWIIFNKKSNKTNFTGYRDRLLVFNLQNVKGIQDNREICRLIHKVFLAIIYNRWSAHHYTTNSTKWHHWVAWRQKNFSKIELLHRTSTQTLIESNELVLDVRNKTENDIELVIKILFWKR